MNPTWKERRTLRPGTIICRPYKYVLHAGVKSAIRSARGKTPSYCTNRFILNIKWMRRLESETPEIRKLINRIICDHSGVYLYWYIRKVMLQYTECIVTILVTLTFKCFGLCLGCDNLTASPSSALNISHFLFWYI